MTFETVGAIALIAVCVILAVALIATLIAMDEDRHEYRGRRWP